MRNRNVRKKTTKRERKGNDEQKDHWHYCNIGSSDGSQNSFPHPTKETLEKLTGNGCKSIAFQIGNNSYSDDDFGNLARECAVCILKELSESMRENETLAEYFLRKEIEFPL